MKGFGKILLGILLVLLFLCVGGGFFLWYSHGGKQVRKLVHNSVQMKKSAERLTRLRTKDAFVPPESGLISEERLKLYIGICEDIGPTVESYLKWVEAHRGNRGSLQDAVDGVKKTEAIFNLLGGELEKKAMGPSEFLWTHETIHRYRGAKELRALGEDQRMLDVLEDCARYSELTETHRRSLEKQITYFRKRLGVEKKLSSSPNIKLLQRYSLELDRYDLSEKSFQIVKGFLSGRGPRRRRVTIKTTTAGKTADSGVKR